MKEFLGKVAVITGAASGIGRGLAERCAQEGMNVVVADINEQALAQTVTALELHGTPILGVITDVTKESEIEGLAQRTVETFGGAHLFFNNAGIGTIGDLCLPVWESALADWQSIIDVNLWGIVFGIRTFVPLMLESNVDCHIINTSSSSGISTGTGIAIYRMTKHAVVSLSETLACQLAQRNAKVKVSVLCPSFVKTDIVTSALVRFQTESSVATIPNPDQHIAVQGLSKALESGIPPSTLAEIVFKAIAEEKFYILTDPDDKQLVQSRMENLLHDRHPATGLF